MDGALFPSTVGSGWVSCIDGGIVLAEKALHLGGAPSEAAKTPCSFVHAPLHFTETWRRPIRSNQGRAVADVGYLGCWSTPGSAMERSGEAAAWGGLSSVAS